MDYLSFAMKVIRVNLYIIFEKVMGNVKMPSYMIFVVHEAIM